MTFQLSVRKARREYGWSLIIVAILTIGLTTWITLPSIGYSMSSALNSYANGESTYIVVIPANPSAFGVSGGSSGQNVLPKSLINQMEQIDGVQSVYPVLVNSTTVTVTNYDVISTWNTVINGTFTEGLDSLKNETLHFNLEGATIGGATGFPLDLVHAVTGRDPTTGEAAFMLNGGALESNLTNFFRLNGTIPLSVAGKNFTAEYVGQNEASPLFSSIAQLYDPNFLKQELGSTLYNQTFGGANGYDYVIVKANSIENVSAVSSNLQSLLETSNAPSAGSFQVVYDQAAVIDLESVSSGAASTYLLLGAFALVLAVSLMFVVNYVAFNRRGWEVGLLLSQGWSWKRVYRYISFYFLMLSGISTGAAIGLSYAILSSQSHVLQIYGSTYGTESTPQLPFLLITLVIVLVLSFVSPRLTVSQLRKQGLDKILRLF